ncbi:PREDICTED: serine/arginine-rich SC35-like splicing factor SCL33 isoform X2 [Camelina sativa]|uniref:Serine/arginine-rich SC35-like splicing factor SCL33 isoform X2 n=1 Tax=Camelina sativa TaxID=90675 RepID=A0ABM0XJG5_CAMSA|nr:PREDICTED: serine/arginine-rich SC35-like splicing factor SCL33 isoform X2 [Camelina sativa]
MGRSYSYSPSPPRSYGRSYRSPSPVGYYRGRSRDPPTSLLVRNLRHDCRQNDLRRPFGRLGRLKDVYIPRNYYTGEPRGFGFVQYYDPADAADAKYHLDGYVLLGREITVVFAEENRKKPSEMRERSRTSTRSPGYSRSPKHRRSYSRSPNYRRSFTRSPYDDRRHSRSVSRGDREGSYSRSSSRSRYESRSRSPSPGY